jgi:hypothetical protein
LGGVLLLLFSLSLSVNIILKKRKKKNGNILLFWERLDATHSFSTSEAPPGGSSVTVLTLSPFPGNQNGHLASKRPRKRAIFSLLSGKHSAACAAVAVKRSGESEKACVWIV